MDPVTIAAAATAAGSLAKTGYDILSRGGAHAGVGRRMSDTVEAAKKLGINPIYALGAPALSGSNIAVGGAGDVGQDLANMGQDLGRVAGAALSKPDQLQGLTLTNMGLQNDLLKAQTAKILAEIRWGPGGTGGGLPPGNTGFLYNANQGVKNQNPYMNPSQIGSEFFGLANELYSMYKGTDFSEAKKMGMSAWDYLKSLMPQSVDPSSRVLPKRAMGYKG